MDVDDFEGQVSRTRRQCHAAGACDSGNDRHANRFEFGRSDRRGVFLGAESLDPVGNPGRATVVALRHLLRSDTIGCGERFLGK